MADKLDNAIDKVFTAVDAVFETVETIFETAGDVLLRVRTEIKKADIKKPAREYRVGLTLELLGELGLGKDIRFRTEDADIVIHLKRD